MAIQRVSPHKFGFVEYLEQMLEKIPTNENVIIDYFLITNYIKQYGLEKISNMDISELMKVKDKMFEFRHFFFPIVDSIAFFNKNYPIVEQLIPQKLSQEDKELLEKNNISTEIDVNLKEQLINTIIEQLKKLDKKARINVSNLQEEIKLTVTDLLLEFANDDSTDTKVLRRIGHEAGIFNNNMLLEYLKSYSGISLSMVHPLLNIDEILEHFENGTITDQEEKALTQQDYIKGLITNIKENSIEKLILYLSKINTKDFAKHICNLFKNREISYHEFMSVITNPMIEECYPNFKKSLKERLKPMLDIMYSPKNHEIIQIFSFKGVYELARLGYVSDIDLINTFKKQEHIRETFTDFDIMYDAMYANPTRLITIENLREHFTSQRLLDNYFKSKDDDSSDIMDFYQSYILRSKSQEEFAEFQTEILNNYRIGNSEIIDLFSAGFITNSKMKALKENSKSIAEMLVEFINTTSKKHREPKAEELYKKYLFELVYDGVIRQNELSDIIGVDKYKEIIFSNLSKNSTILLPENIENISNLGFIKPYSEIEYLENYETEVLSDSNMTWAQVFTYYTSGFISNDKFKELKSSYQELEKELNKFLQEQAQSKSGIHNILYFIRNGIIDEFELIDILGDGEFEKIIKQGLKSKNIKPEDFEKISFIDKKLLLDMYEEDKYEKDDNIDFKYILQIYISTPTSNLISLHDIEKVVDSIAKNHSIPSDFTNLSNYIYQAIREATTVNMQKVKELYLKNYLTFSDLSNLVDEGIITPEDAQTINQKFCTLERLEKMAKQDVNVEYTIKNCIPEHTTRYDENYLPKGRKKQIEQTKLMIDILKSMGYTPKTSTNLFNEEIMDTFEDEELKDYRVFISERNPSAIILMHCVQAGCSNIYYRSGESKSYVVATSDFYNYLTSNSKGLGISAKELLDLQTTKTVYTGKTWQNDLISSVEQINNMLNATMLQEQTVEGDREIKTEKVDNRNEK